jgi:hypothetical protein
MTERSHEGPLHLPSKVSEETARRFAILIYGVEQPERMRQLAQQVIANKIGYLYVTDGKQPNPWDRLPFWWDGELTVLGEANKTDGVKEP